MGTTDGSGSPGRRGHWRALLQVVGLALALLAVSEAVWLWQTWPVRELLDPAAPLIPHGLVR